MSAFSDAGLALASVAGGVVAPAFGAISVLGAVSVPLGEPTGVVSGALVPAAGVALASDGEAEDGVVAGDVDASGEPVEAAVEA